MAMRILGFAVLALLLIQSNTVNCASKRSIDLIAAHILISDNRLPRDVTPNSYIFDIHPFPEDGYFRAHLKINITWQETTDKITLHAHEDLAIFQSNITISQFTLGDGTDDGKVLLNPFNINILRGEMVPKKSLYIIHLEEAYSRGTVCEIDITYNGKLYNDTSEGLFRNHYINPLTGERNWFVATNLRPNLARRVLPCFDEPGYKIPFRISIVRSKTMTALSNMPLRRTEETDDPRWVRDYFQDTPPMSTFTLGIVVSNLVSIPYNNTKDETFKTKIKVWARPDFITAVENAPEKIYKSLTVLGDYLGQSLPIPKLDCIALPNFQGNKAADNWGLIIFKESELSSKGSWQITLELVYQWLGTSTTPFWWNDAHINNALARYLATYTTLKISDGKETFHNWPMTMLYSIYYEFSKRYPHGKVMAIKQDSASTKMELIFRMLNYTLTEKTLRLGLQRFLNDREFKTFIADDIWGAITEIAHLEGTLEDTITVNEIAASWVTKDRLPVLTVTRNYEDNTALCSQRVYLRERPHDVPDQDKFLWWIPIVLVKEKELNFTNTIPITWLRRQKEITIKDLPKDGQFIIVNPEEIGPFPVNYDLKNWNLLAMYLQNPNARFTIPVNTRAKLLHDAWNLAYAGDLDFGTALDMTLFLRHERDHLAWDPVFTMIDHIGRHIDSSSVHQKFLTYVRVLLTPLYEELGDEPQEGESEGRANLRSSSKVFLCQTGYKPCIEEAQAAFDRWMDADNPDEGNPVANQYICPVFKWGTDEEWEFGLQRVINFPADRKQSERTYLLKTLAGCPNQAGKIEKLLNVSIFEQTANFSDNDIYLIFGMLSVSSSGYTTLFHYVENHWDALQKAFETKPQLWNSIITSSTTVFKTQEGLDMVSELYQKKKGKFGTAEFVIEKALKNIKEEAKWSTDNLPVIEAWLDRYLPALQRNK